MPRRRGVSLVELILTLSACSVILTMSAALMHRAMHAQTKARLFFDGERSAWRLSHSFRRDVHDAQSTLAEDGDDGGDLLLGLEMAGGQTVEYRRSAGGVERLWRVAGQVRARESFVFSPRTRLSAVEESPRLVMLSIDPPGPTSDHTDIPLTPYMTPTILRVEAVLGRNPRLAETEAEVEAEKTP